MLDTCLAGAMVYAVYYEIELQQSFAGTAAPSLLLKLLADCEFLSWPVLQCDRFVHRLQWMPSNKAEINKIQLSPHWLHFQSEPPSSPLSSLHDGVHIIFLFYSLSIPSSRLLMLFHVQFPIIFNVS